MQTKHSDFEGVGTTPPCPLLQPPVGPHGEEGLGLLEGFCSQISDCEGSAGGVEIVQPTGQNLLPNPTGGRAPKAEVHRAVGPL